MNLWNNTLPVPRYEWVDVGMLDYDPVKKLYLVKRVQMKTLQPEWKKERFSQLNTPIPESPSRLLAAGGSSMEVVSEPGLQSVNSNSSTKPKPGSNSNTDDVVESDSSGSVSYKDGGTNRNVRRHLKLGRRSGSARKSKKVRKAGDSQYWVPRVRLLFAAEDPRVFADRLSHAHKSR